MARPAWGSSRWNRLPESLARINPLVTVVRHAERLEPENVARLIADYDHHLRRHG